MGHGFVNEVLRCQLVIAAGVIGVDLSAALNLPQNLSL